LITIICDGFTAVRFDPYSQVLNKENEEIKKCAIDKVKRLLGFSVDDEESNGGGKRKKVLQPDPVYMTPADNFPSTVDRLTLFVNDVSDFGNRTLEFD